MSVEDGTAEGESANRAEAADAPLDSHETESLPATLQERFLRIKRMVKDAVDSHRTFMIYGKSRVIRECMLTRGWCEKVYNGGKRNNERNSEDGATAIAGNRGGARMLDASPVALLAGIGDLRDPRSESILVSRMLADSSVDFLWNSGSEWAGWPTRENRSTIFNRYSRAAFTSKIGLCANVGQMHWYYEAGVSDILFPRCYNVSQCDQMHAFVEDFRFTACLSLLKWLVEKTEESESSAKALASAANQLVLKQALEFAIARCTEYIGARIHEDIDRDPERIWSHQWDQFIRWYEKIVRSGSEGIIPNDAALNKYCVASRHLLKKIRKYWQQLDMDGTMNIWILKPGNKSRGRGIVLVDKLEEVAARIDPANKSDARYVVQKYIERPMLIHQTKFDIRQWFIVTCAHPLTLWMYRESYLRFCSRNFRLDDFHEAIHLCNNAVQCKYENSPERDTSLPADNMWDSTTLKRYLKERGHENAWEESIYPGMRRSLVGSLLASQEAMDRRKNSFELYGADFMLMEDFSVWLIEINSHPDMSYSSSVTTRLCKSVMEDTIKVVIDLRENKNADTGLFELAYRQRTPASSQPCSSVALSLQGTRVTGVRENNKRESAPLAGPPRFSALLAKLPESSASSRERRAKSRDAACPRTARTAATRAYVGPVIVDLIEELELWLDREFVARCRLDANAVTVKNSLPSAEATTDGPRREVDRLEAATTIEADARASKSPTSGKIREKETKRQVTGSATRTAAPRQKKYGGTTARRVGARTTDTPGTLATGNEAIARRGTCPTRKRLRRRRRSSRSKLPDGPDANDACAPDSGLSK